MSLNHVLEDGNSEVEEGRISLRKKELEVFVIRTVDQRIHQVIEQNILPMISRISATIAECYIQINPVLYAITHQCPSFDDTKNDTLIFMYRVKQELELAVETHQARLNHHSGSGVQSLESRTLQLEFLDKLSQPVRTRQMIEGEGNTPFRVALVDVTTKQFVTSGPEASAEVEIVVVKGDFDGDNWTVEEFNKKIVREMEGKKSLLTGNVHLNLEAGVGVISNISFTHNSHWMKVCKLRLGAKVVDGFNGARVREAVTEPFVLKDYREIYGNKPSVPSLNDEVWRLKKIGRDGPLHNRLVRENIKTVKDFLTRFFIDPQSLRNIIGNAKILEATVDHAKKCVLDKRLHLYFPIDSEKKSGVVFNDADAKKLVVSALEPTKEVKSFDDEICMHSYLQSLNDAYPSNSPRLESAGHYSCEASQNHYGHDHTQPSTSSCDNQVVPFHSPDDANPSNIPSTDSLDIWSSVPSFGNASHLNEYGWQSIIAEDLINEGPLFSPENLLNPSIFYTEAQDDLSSIVNGFLSTRAAAHIAQRRWSRAIATVRSVGKIIATFKLVSSEAVLASKRPRIY
ncbi:hypothetical protein RHMOL_Rhmol08G0230500 [Rhododendron molle]|uniref:Uncharacterized protein n=1 Tax=Rhododendron molle TaxID=49168 RepID=A0ACC0MTJ3_RHOML|nr:hypothetical protein RHMOL_Rhmol08G0230500 [Rhododendron molle]